MSGLSTRWALVRGRAKYLRKAIKATLVPSHRECCLCGYKGSFIHSGTPSVMDAGCPQCQSRPRHRLLKLALDAAPRIAPQAAILHFASEPSLRPMIAALSPAEYLRADLDPKRGDIVVNIENIDFPDARFDSVICSHVLEHVDDRRALKEIHRILRPGGVLVAMVPLIEGWDATYEAPEKTSRAERKEHFGGQTHVRYYGRDFRARLENAGFAVEEFVGAPGDVERYGLIRGERVFFAKRRTTA
ncbi:MAG: methyltransferase domain-containing protein [Hyphomicrobium sp.]